VATAGRLQKLVALSWVLLFASSLAGAGSFAVQSNQIRRLTLVDGPAVDANSQVRRGIDDAQEALNRFASSGDRRVLTPYFTAQAGTAPGQARLESGLSAAEADPSDAGLRKNLRTRQHLAAQQWWSDGRLVERTLAQGGQPDLVRSRALSDAYRTASEATGAYLGAERDRSRLDARTLFGRALVISIAASGAGLLVLLMLLPRVLRGRRVASVTTPINRPLTVPGVEKIGQRGVVRAHARAERDPSEPRSVATDLSLLTEQNLVLRQIHARDLGTHQITLEIARAIRAASDTQQALDVMCVAMGEGLGADRVIAKTIGNRHDIQLHAQWHRPDLPSLNDLTSLPELGGLDEDLWLTAGFRAQNDVLDVEPPLEELSRAFYLATGARALMMVPIGLDDRVIGMIYVFMVHEPRGWTLAEANLVQAVGGFVARAIVAAEQQAMQDDYVDRIEKLDRQKSDFLATVSHELRTPLTSISGYLEVLADHETGELSGQQHRMLEVISRNTDRLRSLIEDVLVLSRIEGGVRKTDFAEVSIHGVITRVGEELSLLAQGSSIELEIDAGPHTAMVLGDRASLDRAVVNILSNAIKFSRPGGGVTITGTLDPGAGRVLITCQDHGVGIPAKDQVDLFTRFFRATNATDNAIPGTGLGLSIAKQIVEDHHGGRLRLTSVEEQGTTVVMDLPLFEPLFEPSQPHGGVGE
jgi:signal transduction histidine kinase